MNNASILSSKARKPQVPQSAHFYLQLACFRFAEAHEKTPSGTSQKPKNKTNLKLVLSFCPPCRGFVQLCRPGHLL